MSSSDDIRYATEIGSYDPLMVGSIDGTDEIAHDRAVERAMGVKYKPNKNVRGESQCTIFVGRLDFSTSEETLKSHFRKFGHIKSVRVVRDIVTGFSKGYAFVEFEREREAQRAHKDSYRTLIDDREVIVDYEHERKLPGWVPRRLGGGFGGRKESGQLRFGCRYKPFNKAIFHADYAAKSKTYRN